MALLVFIKINIATFVISSLISLLRQIACNSGDASVMCRELMTYETRVITTTRTRSCSHVARRVQTTSYWRVNYTSVYRLMGTRIHNLLSLIKTCKLYVILILLKIRSKENRPYFGSNKLGAGAEWPLNEAHHICLFQMVVPRDVTYLR